MDKASLAAYLVNLHTLMDAQQAIGSNPSTTLGDEYRKNWDLLKSTIEKENEDGVNRNSRNLNESRTNPSRDQPRRGSTVGNDGDLKPNSP